jgi:hypothetical protein
VSNLAPITDGTLEVRRLLNMDSTLLGSWIQAGATFLSLAIATGTTIWQIRKSEQQIIRSANERQQEFLRNSYSEINLEKRSILMAAMDDPAALRWLVARFNLDEKIQEEDYKLYLFAMLQIEHYQNVYSRHKRGLFPNEIWPQWELSMLGSFQSNVFRIVWKSRFQDILTIEFRKYVNEEVIKDIYE